MKDVVDGDLVDAYKAIEDPVVRERVLAVRMARGGMPVEEIARLLCRGRPTVKRWLSWFEDKGVRALIDGPATAIPKETQEVLQLYKGVSAKDIAAALRGEPMSESGTRTVERRIRERGWRGGEGPDGEPYADTEHYG